MKVATQGKWKGLSSFNNRFGFGFTAKIDLPFLEKRVSKTLLPFREVLHGVGLPLPTLLRSITKILGTPSRVSIIHVRPSIHNQSRNEPKVKYHVHSTKTLLYHISHYVVYVYPFCEQSKCSYVKQIYHLDYLIETNK